MRIRSINVANRRLEADITTYWYRGGPYIILDVKRLSIELSSALAGIIIGMESGQNLL